jgi:hypothetical protein
VLARECLHDAGRRHAEASARRRDTSRRHGCERGADPVCAGPRDSTSSSRQWRSVRTIPAVGRKGARGEPARRAQRRPPERRAAGLFSEIQATKMFVGDAAGRIVEQALGLSGGAGYLNGHPLARAYRDVRAGSFMHPLGANRAYPSRS